MTNSDILTIDPLVMVKTPNIYKLVKGKGEGRMTLNAFDMALLDAGVGDTNLVRMSSIVPPSCKEVDTILLPKDGLIPIAYGTISSTKPGQIISTAVAIGIPEDPTLPGVIMEHEDELPLSEVEETVRQMTVDAFAYRNRALKEVKSIGIEHVVEHAGSVFAAVVLWYQ
jgi:arginine decarboxylase